MSTIVGSDTGNYDVYLGFWINWSFGRVKGSTLTLTRESGGLLIAFLALYVSTSGKSIWRIACFFLHRSFSSSKAQDGLYHQRQAILRNSDTAMHSIVSWIDALQSWRKKARRPFRRIVPVFFLALIIYAAFAVAGIFSSRVTTNTANEVLLSGQRCGILYKGEDTEKLRALDQRSRAIAEQYSSQRTAAYMNYASQCYTVTNAAESENCRPYIKPKLSYTATRNGSCPFKREMCILELGNLIMDTGFLDSHNDFGINAPPTQRFQFRMVSQCAPLITKNYSKVDQTVTGTNFPAIRFHYGPRMEFGLENEPFTYQIPVDFSIRRIDNYSSVIGPNPDYIVKSVINDQFLPIPQLAHPDGDVSLMFLAAPGVVYVNPTDDPWFSVHTASNMKLLTSADTDQGVPAYSRDEPVGVLGCISQYQLCNPELKEPNRCEPLNGYNLTWFGSSEQLSSSNEYRTFVEWARTLLFASLTNDPFSYYSLVGEKTLLLKSTLIEGIQTGEVPSNQWQMELEHLFQITLASLQGTFVDNINGPSSSEFEDAFEKPADTSWQRMCQSQKIISARYYSFNVLGTCIILILGGSFIILDFTIESLINWVDRRRKNHKATYARLEWYANSTLQLQRLAHEELGLGTWSNCAGSMPVTEYGEQLGVLDVADKKHPVLMSAPLNYLSGGVVNSESKPPATVMEVASLSSNDPELLYDPHINTPSTDEHGQPPGADDAENGLENRHGTTSEQGAENLLIARESESSLIGERPNDRGSESQDLE